MTPPDHDFIAEVLRINDRYNREVVEAFGVCPFARRAREGGELVRSVLLDADPRDLAPSLAELARIEAAGAGVVVAIVVYPRLALAPREFEHFVERVRAADQERHGGKPVFVAASFHPDYPCNRATPQTLVTFFRRSPDPAIQWVRLSVLEEARGGDRGKFVFDYSPKSYAELERRLTSVSITERITDDNHALVERRGPGEIEAVLADIAADRARSYARLVSRPSPPPGATA